MSAVKNPWEQAAAEVLAGLEVTPERGLSIAEAQRRQQIYGLNILQEIKPKNPWLVLIEQFKSLIVGLLVIACVLSFIFGDWIEGLAIIVVILINAAIGFLTEMKAVRSMEALRKLTQVTSVVRREGQAQQINAQDMVPGDVVILEGGDIVAADLRLIETSKLQADESTLTGESEPVNKHTEPLQGETLLAERYNMLYKGTSVVRGSGIGVVTSIGMQTELGQISALVQKAKSERTPLEKRLDQLGQNLIYVTIGITVLIAVLGIIKGKEALLMIETAIALAVAAIPEGLPIVATIALARGMLRMAERNALINRLASVETLGATTVICTDKTGTLTENKMTVTKYILGSGEYEVLHDDFRRGGQKIEPIESPDLVEALKIGTLCNGASLSAKSGEGQADGVGDPLEVALLVAARKAGILRSALLDKLPKVNEEAFDSDVKMMATIHGNNGGFLVAVKGAPENVLDASSHEYGQQGAIRLSKERRAHWMGANNSLASKGLRVLALAQKSAESAQVKPYENLIFIGLVALSDPPRADIRDAINLCQAAGIRVVMVTGDQPVTAKRIAFETGMVAREDVAVISGKDLKTIEEMNAEERHALTEAAIFARVSPRQKLDIIAAHQARQAVVAMTGDGVNDAPALKKADIGIAMGLRGTQVAREAADMVLKDDAFSTIVVAVEQGRIIFENIRKFVLFLLSCNVSEIAVVAIASFFSTHLPILPLQILFINLVTDVFPALALGVGKGEPRIMEKPPRPAGESILTGRHWVFVALFGMLISAATLGAFGIALNKYHMDPSRIVTISFLTLAFAQLWHTFNMRASGSRFIRNEITRNPAVWGAIVFCGGLLVLAVYTPILARVLNLVDPGLEGWLIVLVMSLMPWAAGQIIRSLRK